MDDPLIAAYLASCATRLAPLSLEHYRRDLSALSALARQAGHTSLASLESTHIRRFLAGLHAQGLAPTSLARKLSCWRGFFSWLSQQPEHAHSKCADLHSLRAPKKARPLPENLSVDQAVALVGSAGGPHPLALCNQAMFELLYSSGLRVAELASLDLQALRRVDYVSRSWIDWENAEVHVTGKRAQQRSVPIGQPAMQALLAWRAIRAELAHPDCPALFVSSRGQRISPRLIQLRLARHARQAGLPVHVHPHMLRHSFASHLLQSSGDLRAVQDMLGHRSIATTQIYTALDFQHLAKVYDQTHPRAKKK